MPLPFFAPNNPVGTLLLRGPNGLLLRTPGGLLTRDPFCCCPPLTCCQILPDELDVAWEISGVSASGGCLPMDGERFTLTKEANPHVGAHVNACVANAAVRWRGQSVLACGDTWEVAFYCCEDEYWLEWIDRPGCVTSGASEGSTLSTVSHGVCCDFRFETRIDVSDCECCDDGEEIEIALLIHPCPCDCPDICTEPAPDFTGTFTFEGGDMEAIFGAGPFGGDMTKDCGDNFASWSSNGSTADTSYCDVTLRARLAGGLECLNGVWLGSLSVIIEQFVDPHWCQIASGFIDGIQVGIESPLCDAECTNASAFGEMEITYSVGTREEVEAGCDMAEGQLLSCWSSGGVFSVSTIYYSISENDCP